MKIGKPKRGQGQEGEEVAREVDGPFSSRAENCGQSERIQAFRAKLRNRAGASRRREPQGPGRGTSPVRWRELIHSAGRGRRSWLGGVCWQTEADEDLARLEAVHYELREAEPAAAGAGECIDIVNAKKQRSPVDSPRAALEWLRCL